MLTCANAVKVVRALGAEKIMFAPDGNLGRGWPSRPKKRSFCSKAGAPLTSGSPSSRSRPGEAPAAKVIIHPECLTDVAEVADAVLTTSQMISCTRTLGKRVHHGHGRRAAPPHAQGGPGKRSTLSPPMFCPNMKMTTLESVAESVEKRHVIEVPEAIPRVTARGRAYAASG